MLRQTSRGKTGAVLAPQINYERFTATPKYRNWLTKIVVASVRAARSSLFYCDGMEIDAGEDLATMYRMGRNADMISVPSMQNADECVGCLCDRLKSLQKRLLLTPAIALPAGVVADFATDVPPLWTPPGSEIVTALYETADVMGRTSLNIQRMLGKIKRGDLKVENAPELQDVETAALRGNKEAAYAAINKTSGIGPDNEKFTEETVALAGKFV